MLEIKLSEAQETEFRSLFNLKQGDAFPSGDAFLGQLKLWRIAFDKLNAKHAGKTDQEAMSLAIEMEANRDSNALIDDAKRRAEEAGLRDDNTDLTLSRESSNPLVENARKRALAVAH